MIHKIKHLLIGDPIPTQELSETKLNKIRALASFSPDALSSIAYANQEIYLGLVVAGAAGLSLALPISLGITILLLIVALSYSQTIKAYPSGGGSYVVARSNLGTYPGLFAGAALMIGYLLTAAVSLTAGVEAIVSVYPALWQYKMIICLGCLLLLTLANLRGLRETGTLMAIPVYLFLITYLPVIGIGLYKLYINGPTLIPISQLPILEPVSLFLVIKTFSIGCTALTGIEAISNGVPSFRHPETKNAIQTLVIMAVLMAILFLGSTALIQYLGVMAEPKETILSSLSKQVVGDNLLYIFVQATTLLILVVAANTSFAGFPRLTAIMAADGYLPHQLTLLGDRLVYSNGVVLLSFATGILIIVFKAESHALVPLFAIGVFLAFTLSQLGMTMHWIHSKQPGRWFKAAINGLGALVTCVTVIIIGYYRLLEGAWITIFLIFVLVWLFVKVNNHYREVRSQLSLKGLPPDLKPSPLPRIVIPISGVHRGIIDAVDFARGISKEVTAVFVEIDPESGLRVRQQWDRWFPDIPLVVLKSPYRSIVGPLLNYLDETDLQHHDGQLAAVLLPEFVPAKWWHAFLHNQTTWLLKTALLYRRRNLGFQRVIIDIPFHLRR